MKIISLEIVVAIRFFFSPRFTVLHNSVIHVFLLVYHIIFEKIIFNIV